MRDEVNKEEQFGERILGILNDAALALMLSIGHKTGLLDVMATLPPSTSDEIAKAAGMQERYVREWLGAMTTGGIVDHDAGAMSFALPPEHAAWLTRTAGPANLAVQTQYIGLLAGVEAQVAECFRIGGGVPYSEYPTFHALMAEESGAAHDVTLLAGILPLVPGIMDRLRAGIDVADVGCGSGHAVNLMAEEFPASRFVGLDLSEEAVAVGRAEAGEKGLTNVRFDAQDAATLDGSGQFDFITTFDSIHDQARPDLALAGIAASLRSGGTYLCVDIKGSSSIEGDMDLPLAPLLYTVSTMHCMTVSLAADGMGLGTMWGERTAREMLTAAGFNSIDVHEIDEDIVNSYYIATKG
ncbi:MAG: class I SAM-dependent methyltransferase [Actinomycetota bacterium]